jgi:tetratricopeptide (TPR) repeat protein
MLKAFQGWLGKRRWRGLIGLLIMTGLASALLQTVFGGEGWVLTAQTLLLVAFLLGAFFLIASAMTPQGRARSRFITLPAIGALGLAGLLPNLGMVFLGVAAGWLIGAPLLLRNTDKREYKQAIRAMRKQDYGQAIAYMSELIKREPNEAAHYIFRAQLHRLNDDLRRAKFDYEKAVALEPTSSQGANGLAEVNLQKGELDEARKWAEIAFQHASEDWVAAYNLGMIAERQGDLSAATSALEKAWALDIPESRHRVLTLLWQARLAYRQGEQDRAQSYVARMGKEKRGLKEWDTILASPEAKNLRGLLINEVRTAQMLVKGMALDDAFAEKADAEG